MRKYFSVLYRLFWGISLFLLAVFSGCDKDFEEVVDVSLENYQVISVSGVKDTVDLKNPSDSLLDLRLRFSTESQVNKVYFDVYASDNIVLNSTPVQMIHADNNIYERQFVLRSNHPIGNYSIRFSVTGSNGENEQVAVGYFYFNNGQDNVAPIISNLILPDSIAKGILFNFSITVNDSNGLSDINKEDGVFFNLYRPDTTIVAAGPFFMHDDGNSVFGDSIAGDGIFSFRNSFQDTSTTQLGYWRFVLQARDRSGLNSNIIEQLLLVTE